MTTEEAIKQADKYVKIFYNSVCITPIYYGQLTIQSLEVKSLAVKNAIKLVDELIKELNSYAKKVVIVSDENYYKNRLSDLQQVKEVLINRLK